MRVNETRLTCRLAKDRLDHPCVVKREITLFRSHNSETIRGACLMQVANSLVYKHHRTYGTPAGTRFLSRRASVPPILPRDEQNTDKLPMLKIGNSSSPPRPDKCPSRPPPPPPANASVTTAWVPVNPSVLPYPLSPSQSPHYPLYHISWDIHLVGLALAPA